MCPYTSLLPTDGLWRIRRRSPLFLSNTTWLSAFYFSFLHLGHFHQWKAVGKGFATIDLVQLIFTWITTLLQRYQEVVGVLISRSLYICYSWPIYKHTDQHSVLYGCKLWSMKVEDTIHLVFDHRSLRSSACVLWNDHIEFRYSVIGKGGKSVWEVMKPCRLRWSVYVHVLNYRLPRWGVLGFIVGW